MSPPSSLDKTTLVLQERIERLLRHQKLSDPKRRILIALAGVPGSGKTTVSDALLRTLPSHGITDVAVLPMASWRPFLSPHSPSLRGPWLTRDQDGFHHTRAALATFDDPELAFRKRGAPFTFDAQALLRHVLDLKGIPVTECDEPEVVLYAPSFDHAVGDPVPDAISISSRCRVVIVEGNYTLLDEEPWSQVAKAVDER